MDGSPPGSPVPGILQARTLEWVAIFFSNAWKWSCSVVSDSLWPHGLQPTRLLHPWDFPGNSTGVGCHCLLQGTFQAQGLNSALPHCRQTLYLLSHQEIPNNLLFLIISLFGMLDDFAGLTWPWAAGLTWPMGRWSCDSFQAEARLAWKVQEDLNTFLRTSCCLLTGELCFSSMQSHILH